MKETRDNLEAPGPLLKVLSISFQFSCNPILKSFHVYIILFYFMQMRIFQQSVLILYLFLTSWGYLLAAEFCTGFLCLVEINKCPSVLILLSLSLLSVFLSYIILVFSHIQFSITPWFYTP